MEQRRYKEVLDGTASEAVVGRALLDLSSHLHRLHGERVVMLIDEYDEPIHAGYTHGYAPQMHSKYMVVDGKSAWIGTSNWEGDYFTVLGLPLLPLLGFLRSNNVLVE